MKWSLRGVCRLTYQCRFVALLVYVRSCVEQWVCSVLTLRFVDEPGVAWSGYLARRWDASRASSHSAAQRHGILSPRSRATPHKSWDYHATNTDSSSRRAKGHLALFGFFILPRVRSRSRCLKKKEFAEYCTFLLSHMCRLRVSPEGTWDVVPKVLGDLRSPGTRKQCAAPEVLTR